MSEKSPTQRNSETTNEVEESTFDEIGHLVFQVLDYCIDPAHFGNYEQVAADRGIPVAHVVAAAITGTLLSHYTVARKECPADPVVVLGA